MSVTFAITVRRAMDFNAMIDSLISEEVWIWILSLFRLVCFISEHLVIEAGQG